MKNEQIVTWFEDLIPEIKKSGDPKDVFLKFAKDKNLSPALLEKLGHVYNTAKTVNYLDKTASHKRGSSFKILDVPDLLNTYEKKAESNHKYSNFGFEDKRVPADLFNMTESFKVNEEPAETYTEVKAASERIQSFKSSAVNEVNTRHYDQLKFELKEDLRDLTAKFASELRSTDIEFEDVERDANYYFEGAAKEACDFLSKNMESAHVSIKRASDSGDTRVIEDYPALNMVGQAQKILCDLHVVDGEQFKSAHVQDSQKEKSASILDQFGNPVKDTTKKRDKKKADPKKDPEPPSPNLSNAEVQGGGDSGSVGGVLSDLNKAILPGAQATASGLGQLGKLYETGNNEQQDMDLGMQEMEHAAILQNLLSTDEILSEEDPEKVMDAYNTFRRLAPQLAGDVNIARVTLRSMVQHDGVSVFDANQFSRAEHDAQKVDNNIRAQQRLDYGKSDDKDRTKVQLGS